MLSIASLRRIPPVAAARAKMGQMLNRSSNRRELLFLGSFGNFAHRQAVGSFRKILFQLASVSLTEPRP
jgi:hypothetical protein